MSNHRDIGIDIAKTIAMISIIMGHLGVDSINRVVFTYHVTLFYFVAGYFTSSKLSISQFVKHRFHTLLVPYYVSSLVIIIISMLRAVTPYATESVSQTLYHWSFATLYGAGGNMAGPFTIYGIGATWFLWALFFGSIMLRILLNIRPEARFLLICFIFAILTWSRRFFWFPLSIQASGAALFFMYTGYIYRQIQDKVVSLSNEQKCLGLGLMLWLWISFIHNFQSFWLVTGDCGRGITDIIGSLAASGIILFLSSLLSHLHSPITSLLSYFGRYTIFMLFMHIIELDTGILRLIARTLANHTISAFYTVFLLTLELLWVFLGAYFMSKSSQIKKLFGVRC